MYWSISIEYELPVIRSSAGVHIALQKYRNKFELALLKVKWWQKFVFIFEYSSYCFCFSRRVKNIKFNFSILKMLLFLASMDFKYFTTVTLALQDPSTMQEAAFQGQWNNSFIEWICMKGLQTIASPQAAPDWLAASLSILTSELST